MRTRSQTQLRSRDQVEAALKQFLLMHMNCQKYEGMSSENLLGEGGKGLAEKYWDGYKPVSYFGCLISPVSSPVSDPLPGLTRFVCE